VSSSWRALACGGLHCAHKVPDTPRSRLLSAYPERITRYSETEALRIYGAGPRQTNSGSRRPKGDRKRTASDSSDVCTVQVVLVWDVLKPHASHL